MVSQTYAWVQHFIYHLAPNGVAGFVLANGSMSSNFSGEGEIRKTIIESDLVDCMIALPGQLFYSTQIPACLWFVSRSKKNGKFRDRSGQTLFIDARKLGHLADRTHKELSDGEISLIAQTYHAWRGEIEAREYQDIPGFCKSTSTNEIASHGFVLTPGRYVGTEEIEVEDEAFEEKMEQLTKLLEKQFEKSAQLKEVIRTSLLRLVYDQ
jgi:type I restriction enzyme M protein